MRNDTMRRDTIRSDTMAVQQGWNVYDTNNDKIGDVAEVGPNYLLVQKGLIFVKDLYIPTSTISQVDETNGAVYLDVMKDDVESRGWDREPMDDIGTSGHDTSSTTSSPDAGFASGTARSTDGGYARDASYTDTTRASGARDTEVLRRHEEDLRAETRREQVGEVNVSKRVVEDTKTIEVPVQREEVQVTRRAVDDRNVGSDAFTAQDETIRVPVMEDQVEVTKTPRVVEELEISKTGRQDTERVSDTVRREEFDVATQGDVIVGEGSRTNR